MKDDEGGKPTVLHVQNSGQLLQVAISQLSFLAIPSHKSSTAAPGALERKPTV